MFGSSGIPNIYFCEGDPNNVDIDIINAPKGAIMIDTTTPAVWVKVSIFGSNADFRQVAIPDIAGALTGPIQLLNDTAANLALLTKAYGYLGITTDQPGEIVIYDSVTPGGRLMSASRASRYLMAYKALVTTATLARQRQLVDLAERLDMIVGPDWDFIDFSSYGNKTTTPLKSFKGDSITLVGSPAPVVGTASTLFAVDNTNQFTWTKASGAKLSLFWVGSHPQGVASLYTEIQIDSSGVFHPNGAGEVIYFRDWGNTTNATGASSSGTSLYCAGLSASATEYFCSKNGVAGTVTTPGAALAASTSILGHTHNSATKTGLYYLFLHIGRETTAAEHERIYAAIKATIVPTLP